MRHVQVTEAKAAFSGLLAAVEAGETDAITRRGRVIARLVPDTPTMAADIFQPFWDHPEEIDLVVPDERPPEPIATL